MIENKKNIPKLITQSDKAYNNGDYISSMEILEKALSNDPTNIEIHYRIGILLSRMGEYKKSIKHLDTVLDSEYKYVYHPHVLTLKGFAQTQINDLKGAKESLTESLKYEGENLKTLSILSFIHYQAKEYEVSIRIYDRILLINPNHFTALNSKGYIFIETEKDIDKGIELCEKAYRINPNSPAVLDSLGWGYYKKKDWEKSTLYIKRAYEILPKNSEIRYHLRTILRNSK
jgi:tetratricopeptide (TPR) repeat protein